MDFKSLNQKIEHCEACPRLRRYCAQVAIDKRRAYQNETYWGKPISGFGDPQARLLIVGLAPAAHGANRTGRVFTGDRSGEWLYRALFKAGYANQPTSISRGDGLQLKDAYINCVIRCAPPQNKPLPNEVKNCSKFLLEEFKALNQARVFIALGKIAFDALWNQIGEGKKPDFKHGGKANLSNERAILMSYHPSQQNTFTGKLTEPMFDSVFKQSNLILGRKT